MMETGFNHSHDVLASTFPQQNDLFPYVVPSFPKRITIEVSSKCHLSCSMCPRKYINGNQGFMSEDLFRKIVDEIEGYPVEAVVPFFRGEPLMHPGFVEMIRLLRERTDAEIQLATNALLLNEDISRALLGLDIHFISFSVDALSKEAYEKIRIGGEFDLVMHNVMAFLKLREASPSGSTMVQVSATENVHNKSELPAFVDFWNSRVDRVRIYPQHSDGGEFGRLNDSSYRRKQSSRQPCMKPFRDIVIYYDGKAGLCNHDWDPQTNGSLGSVRVHSIEEVWHNPICRDIRYRHINHQWDGISPCKSCDHWMGSAEMNNPVGEVFI